MQKIIEAQKNLLINQNFRKKIEVLKLKTI